MLKECKKENAIYKRHALRAVGDVMASLSTDYFDKLFEILNEIFNKVYYALNIESLFIFIKTFNFIMEHNIYFRMTVILKVVIRTTGKNTIINI